MPFHPLRSMMSGNYLSLASCCVSANILWHNNVSAPFVVAASCLLVAVISACSVWSPNYKIYLTGLGKTRSTATRSDLIVYFVLRTLSLGLFGAAGTAVPWLS